MLSWRFAILSERLVKINQALFRGDYWRLITCNYYFPIWIQSADCDGDSPPPQCCLFFSSLSGGLITPQNLLWVSAHFHMLCSPIVPLPQWHSALFNFFLWKWRQLTWVHLKSEYAPFFCLNFGQGRDWFLGGDCEYVPFESCIAAMRDSSFVALKFNAKSFFGWDIVWL